MMRSRGGGFPVAFARKAVALLHQTLYGETRKLFQAVQIFKGGSKGVEAALFQEALHPQLNACGIKKVLPLITVDLHRWRQAIAAFILIDQGADFAIGDRIDDLYQVAHRPGVNRETKLNLRGDFIPVGDRHFTHVIAETAHFQVAGILFRNRLTHPCADALMGFFILPVAGYHAVLLTHPRADEAELAAAVGGLIQVHKVHIDTVPRQRRVELSMELHQRFIQDREAVDPHFRR
ncbi:Uncharacterised protein [Klebsiella oxytoca]|nr:Uncharacterised protein [Klebsiella oxytoca]